MGWSYPRFTHELDKPYVHYSVFAYFVSMLVFHAAKTMNLIGLAGSHRVHKYLEIIVVEDDRWLRKRSSHSLSQAC